MFSVDNRLQPIPCKVCSDTEGCQQTVLYLWFSRAQAGDRIATCPQGGYPMAYPKPLSGGLGMVIHRPPVGYLLTRGFPKALFLLAH